MAILTSLAPLAELFSYSFADASTHAVVRILFKKMLIFFELCFELIKRTLLEDYFLISIVYSSHFLYISSKFWIKNIAIHFFLLIFALLLPSVRTIAGSRSLILMFLTKINSTHLGTYILQVECSISVASSWSFENFWHFNH